MLTRIEIEKRSSVQFIGKLLNKANQDGVQRHFICKKAHMLDTVDMISQGLILSKDYTVTRAAVRDEGDTVFRHYWLYTNLPNNKE